MKHNKAKSYVRSRWIRLDAKSSMVDGGGLNGAGRNSRWNALNA